MVQDIIADLERKIIDRVRKWVEGKVKTEHIHHSEWSVRGIYEISKHNVITNESIIKKKIIKELEDFFRHAKIVEILRQHAVAEIHGIKITPYEMEHIAGRSPLNGEFYIVGEYGWIKGDKVLVLRPPGGMLGKIVCVIVPLKPSGVVIISR